MIRKMKNAVLDSCSSIIVAMFIVLGLIFKEAFNRVKRNSNW